MSYGFAEQKAARRRRWRMIRLLFSLTIFLGLAAASWWAGSKLARIQVERLQGTVATLSGEVAQLRETNEKLEAETATARQSEAEWRAKYESEVPVGRSKELLARIESQIAKGADPDRIAFLVDTAAEKQDCDGIVQTKRFLVRTPLYDGANISVSFADNGIVVSGEGETGSDAEGKVEAWFDPAKPVTISFLEPGGRTTKAAGILPLAHSVVRGGSEFRFTVLASDSQGFVTVTAERCAFP